MLAQCVSTGFSRATRQAPEVRQIFPIQLQPPPTRSMTSRSNFPRLAQTSSPQKTIPSHPTPRTINTCALAITKSSRASVPCLSFFASSPRPSAPHAAPSLPALGPAPPKNRQPAATTNRTVPAVLLCTLKQMLPPAHLQIRSS
jgi:hypothetical protein